MGKLISVQDIKLEIMRKAQIDKDFEDYNNNKFEKRFGKSEIIKELEAWLYDENHMMHPKKEINDQKRMFNVRLSQIIKRIKKA